jgi:hypothetical protein
MPFGLVFRKAVLWHDGKQHQFRYLQESRKVAGEFAWDFRCSANTGVQLEADFYAAGPSIHRLHYLKTDCSGSFELLNNSLARAAVRLQHQDGSVEQLDTATGAVLEMAGGV